MKKIKNLLKNSKEVINSEDLKKIKKSGSEYQKDKCSDGTKYFYKAVVRDGNLYVEGYGCSKKGGSPFYVGRTVLLSDKSDMLTQKWDGSFSVTPVDGYRARDCWWYSKSEYLDDSKEIIKEFVGPQNDTLEQVRNDILKVANKKKADAEKEKMDKIFKGLKPLSSAQKDFLKKEVFETASYMFYEGNKGSCSYCGHEVEIEKPKHKTEMKCLCCGRRVELINKRRKKNAFFDTRYAAFFQKLASGDVVIRYYQVNRSLTPQNEIKFLQPSEEARQIIRQDGTVEDYKYVLDQKINAYVWKKGRHIESGYYYHGIQWRGEGKVYMRGVRSLLKSLPNMSRTGLLEMLPRINECGLDTDFIGHYLKAIKERPFLEWFAKSGFYLLAEQIAYAYDFELNGFDLSARNIHQMMGIDKQCYRKLLEDKESISMKILKYVRENPKGSLAEWKDSAILGIDPEEMSLVRKVTTPHKLLKYYESQKELEKSLKDKDSRKKFGYDFSWGSRHLLSDWCDYIEMCLERAESEENFVFDKKNSMQVFPRWLKIEHDRMCEWKRAHEDEEKRKLRDQKIEALNKFLYKIQEKYNFEDEKEGITISAPEDGMEIVNEGLKLRTCVGNNGYIEDMADGKTEILFVRKSKRPKKPYFTAEVKNGKIVQLRGYQNCAPGEDVLNAVKHFAEKKALVCDF